MSNIYAFYHICPAHLVSKYVQMCLSIQNVLFI